MTEFAFNKRALGDYQILDKYEAGLVLTGPEVKSIRGGGLKLTGAFVTMLRGRPHLVNAHISAYKPAGPQPGYEPTRTRALLVTKKELRTLQGTVAREGYTLVPLRAFSAHNLIKLEFAVGRGRREYEKRERIKERESKRAIKRALRRRP